ncbi:farnesyl-diphosphate farnesyltransferase [Geomicrobium halophilum]|uniref:Farnesyl-diphosphate farnesyltransferase n=1 Tax=Geomicrobium halophilum TaxID=549000 RepID=A0A841PPQ9_9BACL|nr:phytoene/squalene synthase family protein [Geomicrobium halophilum]MBB6450729.1 farnesyl-diphosphate farnesyltransferase [Geomicrobium halophilum]
MSHLYTDAMNMLKTTSRTFFIPISYLSPGLQEGVAGAYLAMRAIDEIEDHPDLTPENKIHLLRSVSEILKKHTDHTEMQTELHILSKSYQAMLPEVTLRLSDWIMLTPEPLTPRILYYTSTMAEGMAKWVEKDWYIENKEDLDDYTYYVAGLVGLLLSDLWEWYDNLNTDRDLAVAFGRGLQSVNIIRNRSEDLDRGVDFFPNEWKEEEMFAYARANIASADAYLESIPPGHIHIFCKIPLMLAHGTLAAIANHEEKLSRSAVEQLVSQAVYEAGIS